MKAFDRRLTDEERERAAATWPAARSVALGFVKRCRGRADEILSLAGLTCCAAAANYPGGDWTPDGWCATRVHFKLRARFTTWWSQGRERVEMIDPCVIDELFGSEDTSNELVDARHDVPVLMAKISVRHGALVRGLAESGHCAGAGKAAGISRETARLYFGAVRRAAG